MKFVVNLTEEDQIELTNVEAAVSNDGQIEFVIEGTISDVGSGTLEPVNEKEVRPVAVTFETTS
ncbi:hypothetical protein OB955_14830 [Halobacteria archaeon AArc-m2/3/4]|uniref:Uncharacterized protein n=1 Tax=Natronoglomus mannanivorans TaxID=2979990 RepID=A0AAP3E4H5_9EURY|nr:hypothetical protein [Halobacteria archaeon AArc-xg1-1]MCU4974006.1 hypothetical protein [Halobacteria archaeon AArc-m2/3/4]